MLDLEPSAHLCYRDSALGEKTGRSQSSDAGQKTAAPSKNVVTEDSM